MSTRHGVLLACLAAAAGFYAWEMRTELVHLRGQHAWLMERTEKLIAQRPPADEWRESLEKKLADATNRAALADARYREERNTHEPLRRQIERMMETELQSGQESAKKDEAIAALRKAAEEWQTRYDALAASNATLSAQTATLSVDKRKMEQELADLRARLARAQAAAGTTTNAPRPPP